MSWALEDDVNDYIKEKLDRLHLKKGEDYNVESSMSDYMKEALRGGAKTKNKSNFGKPDFHIEKYKIPVIFENKLNRNKLIAKTKEGMKEDEKSVTGFAVNGALYYATQMIDSDKYNEVVAIGIAGDSEDDVEIAVYYVYGSSMKTVKLMEGFGQTETCMTLGTMPWMEPKPGSMGKPNAQYDIDLIRLDGTSCEDGEKGQIVVRIGNKRPLGLFKEYYRDPELTKQANHDGVYYTGDIAWRDEDGYYWFVGRADDVIKSSGYRIGPFEVESALMTHPAVVECAITGVPDEIRGMVVKATVVLHSKWKSRAGDELKKELQEHVKRETAPYKYPRIVEFVDELPKTISGKIRRVEIRQKDNAK